MSRFNTVPPDNQNWIVSFVRVYRYELFHVMQKCSWIVQKIFQTVQIVKQKKE